MKSSDHALAVLKAALNLIPCVGGAVASLVGDYIPSSTQRSINGSLAMLAERLEALQGRVDVDAVDKDEFAELFKSCYLIIVRTHQEAKLRAASNLLANLLLSPGDHAKLSYEELDHLVRCVDALSIGAIAFLGAVRQLIKNTPSSQNWVQFGTIRPQFPGMEPSLLMSLAAELNALNLVHVARPQIQVAEYDNYGIELTPVGARLVDRVIEGNF